MAVAAVIATAVWILEIGAASASTVSFSDQCCFDMRIAGDQGENQLRLTAKDGRIVLRDAAPGASIRFRGPASRCTGQGTATLSCDRAFLVNPITVLHLLGPGDSFDTGADGCAGGAAFALADGSRERGQVGKADVWGGPYSDRFAVFGRATSTVAAVPTCWTRRVAGPSAAGRPTSSARGEGLGFSAGLERIS